MAESITAPALKYPNIQHGFFTRGGGVSTDDFTSLNVGYGSGDELDAVKQNRLRVARRLGSKHDDIVTCYQIHSAIVHTIDAAPDQPLEGDALVTKTPGLAIAVLTADCVPVLFADVEAGVIGAAHAGWKGAHGGVVENTIDAMVQIGAKREHIYAVVGPAIAQESYEVGEEIKKQFIALDPQYAEFFDDGIDSSHFQFDLPGLVESQISALGVAKSENLYYDTYANEEIFYSFRRATHNEEPQYGRQCSAIMLV